jgi:hypothetical protein
MKIFVQIASYRDPELKDTVKDLLQTADHPEDINIGICWQHDPKDEWEAENIEQIKNITNNVKVLNVNYKDSKGACWARSLVQKLYDHEDFSLQIDSHSRFDYSWDTKLKNIFEKTNDDKAIISTYPSLYSPGQPREKYDKSLYVCHVYGMKNGEIQARPNSYQDYQQANKPRPAVAIAAGFIFGRGHVNSIRYDPDFYFTGEEAAMALRYYTNGYNLYHPHEKIMYHFYIRKNQKKHWSDHSNWHVHSTRAHKKLGCLLGRNNDFDLGEFCLGKERSLEDWTIYSGIDYKNKAIHKDVLNNLPPPYSYYQNCWVLEKNMKK